MTFGTTRAEIAAALSTVAGVRGYETRPDVLTVGAAWPLMGPIERGPGLSFLATWRVIVVLGGDEVTAVDKLDELLVPVAVALSPVAFVDSANPATLATEGGEMFAVEITARSE